MTKEIAIKLFQDQSVRVEWDNNQEIYLFLNIPSGTAIIFTLVIIFGVLCVGRYFLT